MNQRTRVTSEALFVPDRLRERDQFVVYRLDEREGKLTKVPYDARTGTKAATTRPATWASFDTVVTFYAQHEWVDGIGFVFAPDDGLAGIDLDHCRDPESGAIEPWAQTIINFFDSYAEASPSGTGVHILLGGVLQGGGRKHDRIEVYDRGRYFTVTSDHLDGTPWTVEDRQQQLDELYLLVGGGTAEPEPIAAPSNGARADTFERLQIALASKNGSKLRRLLDGDNAEYGDDPSDGDMGACCILAWYLDHDEAAIDEVIRFSARFRPKWDEPHYADGETYGDHTIREAIRFVGSGCYGDRKVHFLEPPGRSSDVSGSVPAFKALTVDEWLNLEDDAADVVIGDGGDGFILSIDGKGALAGGPGIGKSNLLLRLSRCLAQGTPFLQLPIPRPRRVLYLAAEGSRRGIKKRMAKVWADAAPEIRERFHLGLVQVDLLEDEGALDALIQEHTPEVIILDPLRNAHTLDENSSQDVARLIAVFDRLIARHACAVILAHHGRKEHPLAKGEPGIDNVRGSTALTGWLSFVLTVRRKPKHVDVLLADWVKVRDAEAALPALEVEFVRSVIDFKAATRSEEADLADTIKTLVSDAGSIRTPDLLPKVRELSNRGAKAIRAALADLVRTGVLVKGRMPGDRADSYRLGEAVDTHEDADEDF